MEDRKSGTVEWASLWVIGLVAEQEGVKWVPTAGLCKKISNL